MPLDTHFSPRTRWVRGDRARAQLPISIGRALSRAQDEDSYERSFRRGQQLFRSYTTGMEASWALVPASIQTAAPELTAAIDKRMQTILDEQAPLETRWRNAYVCEQLLAQLLPQDNVIAEGDWRLFETKALAMKSADGIGLRWEAGKKDNPPRIEGLSVIYTTLLDELHWLYGKRSIDRRTRNEIASPMLLRA
jgi:hypothetical protein